MSDNTTADRHYGKITFWNKKKGYGFIKREDGQDFFFHASRLFDGLTEEQVKKDLTVGFNIIQHQKGAMAINIDLLENYGRKD